MWRHFAPFVVLSLLACGSSPTEPVGSIPFTTLTSSKVSGAAGPQIQTVVYTEAAWSQVWSELWSGREPAPPAVDFRSDMVVLVTASQTCAGGAEVEEIADTGGQLQIRYGDAAPSLCLCVQAELAFHAVRAPKVFGTPRFEVRQTPPLCG